MSKSKVESTKSTGFSVKGGSAHMSGKNSAGPQHSGVSSQEGKGGGKFAVGGGKDPIGLQHAGPQASGVSQTQTTGDGGKFAVGGKGADNHMFGKQCADTAKPA